jgi:aminopeptidase N
MTAHVCRCYVVIAEKSFMNAPGNWALCFLLITVSTLLGNAQSLNAYGHRFAHADSLRGGLRTERTSYDMVFYDLSLSVDPVRKSIEGSNVIRYKVVRPFQRMQVDLFANMTVQFITQPGRGGKPDTLAYVRDGNAIFITLAHPQTMGQMGELTIAYSGSPHIARNAPWDGGFIWQTDTTTAQQADWVTVACEGTGASLWWPCKDHLSDEPDSMRIRCRVPAGLTCVANGQFVGQTPSPDGQQTEWTWFVHYPINNYNVTLNITDYAHLTDTYTARDGKPLRLDYYVLPGNVAKAKTHFEQVKTMLACYETYFGKYPFWRDGYKLVETPYWGMEHQSAVAYGNKYENNPFGFDFIIIHESAHEYFGNSLSCADQAEIWIHESFTTYAETLFMECTQGKQRAMDYLNTQRRVIRNQYPMLGPPGVNADQLDTDIYYKGAWMLHTMRQAVGNDIKWFAALKALTTEKKLSIVNTNEVIDLLSQRTGFDLRPIASQYLRHASLPTLEYYVDGPSTTGATVHYRWVADERTFNLPVQIRAGGGSWQTIRPTRDWKTAKLPVTPVARLSVNTENGLFNVLSLTGE